MGRSPYVSEVGGRRAGVATGWVSSFRPFSSNGRPPLSMGVLLFSRGCVEIFRGCVEKTDYAVFDEHVWKRRKRDTQRSRGQQSEERSEWSGVHPALLSPVGR